MNIWEIITAKLWKWYKGHDGIADAHHAKYTDTEARNAIGDILNPCNIMYIDSSNLGAPGNNVFRIRPDPLNRHWLRFDNLTTGAYALLSFGAFEVPFFYLGSHAFMHKNGVPAPYWFRWIDANSGQIRLNHIGSIEFEDDALLKDLKNHAASGLSGTQKDIEIDIGGVSYYFTVYPTKA